MSGPIELVSIHACDVAWGAVGSDSLTPPVLMLLGPTTSAPKDVMRRLVGSEALVDRPTDLAENMPQASTS